MCCGGGSYKNYQKGRRKLLNRRLVKKGVVKTSDPAPVLKVEEEVKNEQSQSSEPTSDQQK